MNFKNFQTYQLLINMRPKQRIKNLIILAPLIFSGELTNTSAIRQSLLCLVIFSIFVGTTYIINDYKDISKDKNHPKKKLRPLASGKLNQNFALISATILWLLMLFLSFYIWWLRIFVMFLLYLLNTTIYNFFFKKIEIIDIFSIAIWFVIRGLIWIFIISAIISPWLLIMLFFGALWLWFLKRYQEVMLWWNTRQNIHKYNAHFLEQIISMITTIILVAYTLYTFNSIQSELMLITVPIVAFWIIRYYYNIFYLKKYEHGIEEIFLKDKYILFNILFYIIVIISIVLIY